MIVDARALSDRSILRTDVCIVGAGPAGITLARELSGMPFRVCLVESGGTRFDPETQALAQLSPDRSTDLTPGLDTRRRQFGGTANVWNVRATSTGHAVRYLPLSPIDFETRSWIPHSGWPFTRADLEPYYARAHSVCGLSSCSYRVADWERPLAARVPLNAQLIETSIEQYGDASVFTHAHRDTLCDAPGVTVLLHANATALRERPTSASIGRVDVECLNGRRHEIRSSLFILACGALENARLLLLSTGRSGAGIGNQHDRVGRFFMEHHNVRGGLLPVADPAVFAKLALYDLRRVDDAMIMAKLIPSEDLMRRERLLHAAARIEPRPPDHAREAAHSVRSVGAALRAGRVPSQLGRHVRSIAHGLPHLMAFELPARWSSARRGRYGWSTLGEAHRRFAALAIELQIELSPDPGNRVLLADGRDRFGRPLPSVHWKWRDRDRASLRGVQRALAAAFASAGMGSMVCAPAEQDPEVLMPGGTHHHMGTTRMHVDATQGVVDSSSRVHGVDNLFVAGSSVFPTGGYANPTLTIVALAVRLADHVRSLMHA